MTRALVLAFVLCQSLGGGAGVRGGGALAWIRLIDIAPTAARLLGVTPPLPIEGRALDEILR